MTMETKRYKIFGIVTNRDTEGNELINWLHKRCGKSEEAHAIMKEDLAGGRLPSADFGENAAWWWIMILAFNLNAAMKQLALGGSWVTKRMKALRFSLISLPGRVIEPCAGTGDPACQGPSVPEDTPRCAAADHGAWLCTIGVSALGGPRRGEQRLQKSLKGGLAQNCLTDGLP